MSLRDTNWWWPTLVVLAFLGGVMVLMVYDAFGAPPPWQTQAAKDGTRNMQKLGEALYHDPRLSRPPTTSCNTCHNVTDNTFTDGLPTAVGRKGLQGSPNGRKNVQGRKSPDIRNSMDFAHLRTTAQFIDERAPDAFEQCIGPIANPDEMADQTPQQMVDRLSTIAGYRKLTLAAFGHEQMTVQDYQAAMVSYERTFIANDTLLGRYLGLMGKPADKDALFGAEQRGAEVMRRSQCFVCHEGRNFTNGLVANNGWYYRFPKFDDNGNAIKDIGAAKTSGEVRHTRTFKIPSLVNVGYRVPLMSHGNGELRKIIREHYYTGGIFKFANDPAGTRRRDPYTDEYIYDHSDVNNSGYWTDQDMDDVEACLRFATIPINPPSLKPPRVLP